MHRMATMLGIVYLGPLATALLADIFSFLWTMWLNDNLLMTLQRYLPLGFLDAFRCVLILGRIRFNAADTPVMMNNLWNDLI